jgi:hypothetical protein
MGIVYLIQPAECAKGGLFKVGFSGKDDFSRLNSYKNGSVPIVVFGGIQNPRDVEADIIRVFGREYFDGDVERMRDIFVQVVLKHARIETNKRDVPEKETVDLQQSATNKRDVPEKETVDLQQSVTKKSDVPDKEIDDTRSKDKETLSTKPVVFESQNKRKTPDRPFWIPSRSKLIHECPRCNYTTDCKSNFNRHIYRKIPCNVLEVYNSIQGIHTNDDTVDTRFIYVEDSKKYECKRCLVRVGRQKRARHMIICKGVPKNMCDFCRKTFNTPQSKCNHRKTCKARPVVEQNTRDEEHHQIMTTHGFTHENVDYLSERIRQRDARLEDFETAYDLVYHHPDHPENHTIRKISKKDDIIHVRNEEGIWQARLSQNVLNLIIENLEQKLQVRLQNVPEHRAFRDLIWFKKSEGPKKFNM